MARITLTPHKGPVRVVWKGQVVAQTDRALDLSEADYPVVVYVPRDAADMRFFEKTAHHTHCPHKGDASYFTLHAGPTRAENVVWSYETPFEAVTAIAGHLAFYPQHVSLES